VHFFANYAGLRGIRARAGVGAAVDVAELVRGNVVCVCVVTLVCCGCVRWRWYVLVL